LIQSTTVFARDSKMLRTS